MKFGELVRNKRISQNMTLREFCRKTNEDPSNWSKIERGYLPPPKEDKLSAIASVLGIEEGSIDWKSLYDLASIESGMIPKYFREDKELLEALPIFLRTVHNVRPTEKEMVELIDSLRKI